MQQQQEMNTRLEVRIDEFTFENITFSYEILIMKNGKDLPLIHNTIELKPIFSISREKAFRERLVRKILDPLHRHHAMISQPEYARIKELLHVELEAQYEDVLRNAFRTARERRMSL